MAEHIRQIDVARVDPAVRRIYNKAIFVALLGNAALLGLKAYAARVSGSSALYSDTANSASDLAYSLLMMLGLWLSLRPPDRSHPHGHERIESLVTVAIGAFMGIAGYEALRSALAAWQVSSRDSFAIWVVAVPLVAALVKAGMYVVVKRLGRAVQSPAILASAADHLSDIATSAVVLVGLAGALLNLSWADAVAGLLVAGWILYQASRVVMDGVGQLIGHGGSAEQERAIVDAILSVDGVVGVDKVVIEYVGPGLRVDIHVYVDGSMSVKDAHAISHAVREAVQALDEVDHAFVHVEPAATV